MTSGMHSSSISHFGARDPETGSVSERIMRKPERQSSQRPDSRFPERLCSLARNCCEKSGFANSFIRKAISVFPISLEPLPGHALRLGEAYEVAGGLRQAGTTAPDHADLDDRKRARDVAGFDAVAFQRPGAVDEVGQQCHAGAGGHEAAHSLDGASAE